MSARLCKAVLTVSIDLELGAVGPERRAVLPVVEVLLELLAQHQIAATWAVADPTSSSAERVAAHRASHEIALWGDAAWAGPAAPRSRFGAEVARRIDAGHAQGMSISSLVVPEPYFDQHAEAAVRHGLSAVRLAAPAANKPRPVQPRTLRFGLWSFPVTLRLPGESRWMSGGGGGRAARQVLDRGIAERGLVQLAIDATGLAARGHAADRVVDSVLAHAKWRRSQGVLDVATIGATVARLASQYQTVPSRSILRPAA